MHISEGVLSGPVLAGGAVLTAGGMALGLKKIDYQRLPTVALLAAVFFLAGLVHLPLGPFSVHLVLSGLLGLLLGWAVFPAVLVGLTLQAVLFQFGGLVVLGVNTAVMALPAALCHYLLRAMARRPARAWAMAAGFLAGSLSILGSAAMAALALWLSGEAYHSAAQGILAVHLPLMAVEGAATAVVAGFLSKVRPAALAGTVL